jgi:hypothetical protein
MTRRPEYSCRKWGEFYVREAGWLCYRSLDPPRPPNRLRIASIIASRPDSPESPDFVSSFRIIPSRKDG